MDPIQWPWTRFREASASGLKSDLATEIGGSGGALTRSFVMLRVVICLTPRV